MEDDGIKVVWARASGRTVCALTDGTGHSRVDRASLDLLGGRSVWIYAATVTGEAAAGAAAALLRATFTALDADFEPPAGGPLGLCVLSDAEALRADPAAAWSDPPMVHAGFLPDGTQVRVGYFTGARIGG